MNFRIGKWRTDIRYDVQLIHQISKKNMKYKKYEKNMKYEDETLCLIQFQAICV